MKTFNTLTRALICLSAVALSGCFSHEWSHVIESRADELETVKTPIRAEMDALIVDGTTIYFPVIAARGISSACVGGILLVPLDARLKGEKTLNDESQYSTSPIQITNIQIGIKPDQKQFNISLSHTVLEYLGHSYLPTKVVSKARLVTEIERLAPRDEITWYVLTFPVKIDARNRFSLSLDQYADSDRIKSSRTIRFGPRDVHRESEYGERGC